MASVESFSQDLANRLEENDDEYIEGTSITFGSSLTNLIIKALLGKIFSLGEIAGIICRNTFLKYFFVRVIRFSLSEE